MSKVIFYLAQDVADLGVRHGLKARSGSAYRQAVYAGRLRPSGFTVGGIHVWTEEDAHREVLRLVKAAEMKRQAFELGRRLDPAEGEVVLGDGLDGPEETGGSGR